MSLDDVSRTIEVAHQPTSPEHVGSADAPLAAERTKFLASAI
jgi:hypothetical protein